MTKNISCFRAEARKQLLVLKIGLAFCDKAVVSVYEQENLLTHEKSTPRVTKVVSDAGQNDW